EIIRGTRRAASEHDLPVESLSQREVKARYPTLKLWKGEVALFEIDGGVLDPERAIRAHLQLAESGGAEMRFGVAMESWHATDKVFELHLADGPQIPSCTLILARGARSQEAL